ncbi:MAG: hypothetical protein WC683_07400 [bacterium]
MGFFRDEQGNVWDRNPDGKGLGPEGTMLTNREIHQQRVAGGGKGFIVQYADGVSPAPAERSPVPPLEKAPEPDEGDAQVQIPEGSAKSSAGPVEAFTAPDAVATRPEAVRQDLVEMHEALTPELGTVQEDPAPWSLVPKEEIDAFASVDALVARVTALHQFSYPLAIPQNFDEMTLPDLKAWFYRAVQAPEVKAVADKLNAISLAENLPKIIITEKRMREATAEALEALYAANTPPEIFGRGGEIVRVDRDEDGLPIVRILTEAGVKGVLDRVANWYMIRTSKNGAPYEAVAYPVKDVVRDVMALGRWDLPQLAGIIESPLLRPDGTLSPPGYDPETRFYYAPAPTFSMPTIPISPTEEEVEAAVALLQEVIEDFPFADEASRANTIAAIVTAIVRPLIPGPVPMVLFNKPQAGTGASLLAEIVALIATGRPSAMMAAPEDDAAWKKSIMSVLLKGRLVICVDNIEGKLYAPSLAALLTADVYEDRVLGVMRMQTMRHRAVWIGTGNNIQLGGDLPRRCYMVRMDAKTARPWQRENFKHPDLRAWVLENRGRLVAAVVIMVKNWIAGGRLVPSNVPKMGGFEGWVNMVSGILAYSCIPGFLVNLEEMYEESDADTATWESFLELWHAKWGEDAITVAEVVTFLMLSDKEGAAQSSFGDAVHVAPSDLFATLPDEMGNVSITSTSFSRKLGKALAKKENVRYRNGCRIERGKVSHKVATWKVSKHD